MALSEAFCIFRCTAPLFRILTIMKITASQLRRIVKEELNRLHEAEDTPADAAGASSLTDQQKKKLKAFTNNPPTGLNAFAVSMKTLGSILGDIDEKSANINSEQVKKYFMQVMAIVDSMMSEKKTTSAETAKVTKAVGG